MGRLEYVDVTDDVVERFNQTEKMSPNTQYTLTEGCEQTGVVRQGISIYSENTNTLGNESRANAKKGKRAGIKRRDAPGSSACCPDTKCSMF